MATQHYYQADPYLQYQSKASAPAASPPANYPSSAYRPYYLFEAGRPSSPSLVSSGGHTFSSASGYHESSSASYSGVDLRGVLSDRMQDIYDPIPLDKGLAEQAQTSGRLNAKQQELLELQALAQRRLKNVRSNFNEGLKTARETKRDLEWTEKRVSALKTKAEKLHPEEYRRSSKKYTYDGY